MLVTLYKMLEKAETKQEETDIQEIIATLQNYEYLKSKLPTCRCLGTMYIEKICIKCGGVEDDLKPIFVWKW